MHEAIKHKNPIQKNLIGKVFWDYIKKTVRHLDNEERQFYLLIDQEPQTLLEIANETPQWFENEHGSKLSVLLKIHPENIENPGEISQEFLSKESPTHFRHSDEAKVIVIAPLGEAIESVGAGLSTAMKIDEDKIISQIESWLETTNGDRIDKDELRPLLQGLEDSKICLNLKMWVDFFVSLLVQKPGILFENRVQNALYTLRLPIDSLKRFPNTLRGVLPSDQKNKFKVAFLAAHNGPGKYAQFLVPKKLERINIHEIQDNLNECRNADPANSDQYDVIQCLIDDEKNIGAYDWRDSQKKFCESVSWKQVGSKVFERKKNTNSRKIGAKTMEYILGDYASDVTEEDRQLLKEMPDKNPSIPDEKEIEFFNDWAERLANNNKLFQAWQSRLYYKENTSSDLLGAFFEGFESLIANSNIGDTFDKFVEPAIIVRATKHNKASFWKDMDKETYDLFIFELSFIKGLVDDSVFWDLDTAFGNSATDSSKRKDKRAVELDLYLVNREDLDEHLKDERIKASVPRVKTTWRPFPKTKDNPINLSLVEDIRDLAKAAKNNFSIFRELTIKQNFKVDDSFGLSFSLENRDSFQDVQGFSNGRLFCSSQSEEDNLIEKIIDESKKLLQDNVISEYELEEFCNACRDFEAKYKEAIIGLNDSVNKCVKARIIEEQADAFGKLCWLCRDWNHYKGNTLRTLIAKLGVVIKEDEPVNAIIPAWHPLRLNEKREKVLSLQEFVKSVLTSKNFGDSNLDVTFEVQRKMWESWSCPEVVHFCDTDLVSATDIGGYSLMVPILEISRQNNKQYYEVSATEAANSFVQVSEDYFKIHPHQKSHLSTLIYESQGDSLPYEVAKAFSKKLDNFDDLRCELVLTNTDQERMRELYEHQNELLATEKISEIVRGFLSRLYVDVRNFNEQENRPIAEMDLVFLHEVVFSHSEFKWIEEKRYDSLFSQTTSKPLTKYPRRRITPKDESVVGVYITNPHPERRVANYNNLMYQLSKKSNLQKDHDGFLIQEADVTNSKIKHAVESAHQLGDWVISYDSIVSKTFYEKMGLKIISDESLPESLGRLIISTNRSDEILQSKIREALEKFCGFRPDDASNYSESIIQEVLMISGKKILSVASMDNAAKEIIGLVMMKQHMEKLLIKEFGGKKPIWISLDDHRNWFLRRGGSVADAIAVYVTSISGDIKIYFHVGEAKCIEFKNKSGIINKATQQLKDTTDLLKSFFIDYKDEVSFKGFCSRLADLLVNRDQITSHLLGQEERKLFFDKLIKGEVQFFLGGESVISIHDEYSTGPKVETNEDWKYLRSHVISGDVIKQYVKSLTGEDSTNLADPEAIKPIHWYSSDCNGTKEFPTSVAVESPKTPIENLENDNNSNQNKEFSVNQDSSSTQTNDINAKRDIDPSAVENRNGFFPHTFFEVLKSISVGEANTIDDESSKKWAEKVSTDIQRALNKFGMEAVFDSQNQRYQLTPNGALIYFKGHETLTIKKIEKIQSELLTTYGIEINDIIPGRGHIALFTKRDKRLEVPLASTWINAGWSNRKNATNKSLAIGVREDQGNLLYLNISKPCNGYNQHAPHTLIAGETGSGKSVLIQNLLLQIIAFNDPRDAELILIDPKSGVDFAWLEGAPHMSNPILTERKEARNTFEGLISEMERRYKLFKETSKTNIDEYNESVSGGVRLKRIFLFHDELGSWMAEYKGYREIVLSTLSSLGMKARAAGIHLFLITQRADAEAVPTRLRDNCGNRLCLRVQNSQGSRMVLNKVGAEKLLGRGHIACILGNQQTPSGQEYFTAQVPFSNNSDLNQLAKAAKDHWSQ